MSYDRSWDNFEKLSPVKKKSIKRKNTLCSRNIQWIINENLYALFEEEEKFTIFGDQSHVSSVVCVTDDYSVLLWNHLKNLKSFAEQIKK